MSNDTSPADERPPFRPGEAARRIGVTVVTLRRMVADGTIAAFPIGNTFRVPAEEIDRIVSTSAARSA